MKKIIKKIELIILLNPIFITLAFCVFDFNTISKETVAFVVLALNFFLTTFIDDFFRKIENSRRDLSDETEDGKDIITISHAIRFMSLLIFFVVIVTVFSERVNNQKIKLAVACCSIAIAALQYFFTVKLIKKTEINQ